jgi:hypothetical protein
LNKEDVSDFYLFDYIFLFCLRVRDQVSHPYKTTGKIIVLCSTFSIASGKVKGKGKVVPVLN